MFRMSVTASAAAWTAYARLIRERRTYLGLTQDQAAAVSRNSGMQDRIGATRWGEIETASGRNGSPRVGTLDAIDYVLGWEIGDSFRFVREFNPRTGKGPKPRLRTTERDSRTQVPAPTGATVTPTDVPPQGEPQKFEIETRRGGRMVRYVVVEVPEDDTTETPEEAKARRARITQEIIERFDSHTGPDLRPSFRPPAPGVAPPSERATTSGDLPRTA